MSNQLLRDVGEALYGARWQTELAHALIISPRTMRRWAAGQKVPQAIYLDLLSILDERSIKIAVLVDRLESGTYHDELLASLDPD